MNCLVPATGHLVNPPNCSLFHTLASCFSFTSCILFILSCCTGLFTHLLPFVLITLCVFTDSVLPLAFVITSVILPSCSHYHPHCVFCLYLYYIGATFHNSWHTMQDVFLRGTRRQPWWDQIRYNLKKCKKFSYCVIIIMATKPVVLGLLL